MGEVAQVDVCTVYKEVEPWGGVVGGGCGGCVEEMGACVVCGGQEECEMVWGWLCALWGMCGGRMEMAQVGVCTVCGRWRHRMMGGGCGGCVKM